MLTRREWILGSFSALVTPAILQAQQHALRAVRTIAEGYSVAFAYLSAREAQTLSALAAEIIPSDDGPGATEAGAIYFIDHALATFDADKREIYKQGLGRIEVARAKLFPASAGVADLTGQQRQELIRGLEKDEFFEVLRTHVVLGFLANPEYGGNRDNTGWKYIEFDNQMAFEPPFGFYDDPRNGEAK